MQTVGLVRWGAMELWGTSKFKQVVVVSTVVLTLGAKSILELDDRSCLGCLVGVSNECKYVGCLDESA